MSEIWVDPDLGSKPSDKIYFSRRRSGNTQQYCEQGTGRIRLASPSSTDRGRHVRRVHATESLAKSHLKSSLRRDRCAFCLAVRVLGMQNPMLYKSPSPQAKSEHMKPRHAAALALVGWYLMVPPCAMKGKVWTFSSDAPIHQWKVEDPFDRAADCARAQRFHIDAVNPNGSPNFYAYWLSAQCIATDDLRLKGN